MEDILKIATSLKDSGLLLKEVSETLQNEAKEQRGGFFSMLLGTLGASLLGDMLFRKKVKELSEQEKEQLEQAADLHLKGLH